MAEHLHRAHCVVLPSYREGTPKTLPEATDCDKPLVNNDVPGCRETVQYGHNGYLCQIRSADDLAAKPLQVAQLPPAGLAVMGEVSRQLATEKFDKNLVLREYLSTVAVAGTQ